jgi:hypothetical protein
MPRDRIEEHPLFQAIALDHNDGGQADGRLLPPTSGRGLMATTAQDRHRSVSVEFDVPVPTRDGIRRTLVAKP